MWTIVAAVLAALIATFAIAWIDRTKAKAVAAAAQAHKAQLELEAHKAQLELDQAAAAQARNAQLALDQAAASAEALKAQLESEQATAVEAVSRVAVADPSCTPEEVAAEVAAEADGNMSDLDDILDDAFDEMDILDDVADDMLLDEAAEVEAPKPPRTLVANNAPAPRTWQETLAVLEPAERVEWARTIAKDMAAQSTMLPQHRYSFAYQDGDGGAAGGQGGSAGEAAVSAILQGSAVLTPEDPDTLLLTSLEKAILVVNKRDSKGFAASAELRALFRNQVKADLQGRFEYHDVERANILAEPERFPCCAELVR